MLKKRFLKLSRSLLKLILPITFKILIKLKLNRRVINYLHERSYNSNNLYDFTGNIKNLLKDKKIVALDVGAQGGFNSDNFFPSKYNYFFEDILIEPIESEINKLKEKKFVINKGVWSEKEKKKLFILDNRLGSSSMYKPDIKNFDLHEIKKDDYKNYDVTRTTEIECDSIKNLLSELDLKNLDYLKVDTQGAELEIIKGLGVYRPLLIKIETHIYSMYKNVWNHGDWATETKSGGFIIHGRSDATLNRSGVRIGTAEFYALFDKREDIDDSLIIHLSKQGEDALYLFLKANSKIDLNELKRDIRKNCSPRHVPDYIYLVPDIPYTISGKKVEIPIKKLLSGISLDKALSKESLRNPEGLEWFKEFVLNGNSSITS